MIILPAKLYLTISEYYLNGKYGIGSRDVTDDRDEAYDQYAEARGEARRVRVFMIELHPDSNAPDRITEVTEDMEQEFRAICEGRGIDVEDAA